MYNDNNNELDTMMMESIMREHGAPGPGRYANPDGDNYVSNVPDNKSEFRFAEGGVYPDSNLRDSVMREHGGNSYAPQQFIGELDPSRTLEQSIMYEHGGDAYTPREVVWGTDEKEAIEAMQIMYNSESISRDALSEWVAKLPKESIVKVVNKRFNDSANIMDDRGLTASKQIQLGERLYTDFNIILEAINQNKDLSGEEFNKSQYAGDKKTDLNGLLKAYQNSIQNTGKDIVLWDFNGMPVVKSNNEEMKAEEMLSVIRQKAMENSQGMEMDAVSKAV